MTMVRANVPVNSPDIDVALVPCGFVINGTSNPLVASNFGDEMQGQQVTRSSAGVFTFQIRDTTGTVLGIFPACQLAVAADITLHAGPSTPIVGGANSLAVRTMTGATPTDPATLTPVYFLLLVKRNTRRASQ